MKYNLNINQYAVFNNPEFASLTLQDLVVFDFVKDFANSSSCKRNSDGYFWIKHSIVSDALPILGIFNEENNSRKDICRAKIAQIMRKLCRVGLLSASPDNEERGMSEYAFGANYDKMIFSKSAQKNSDPSKNLLPPYQNSTTPPSKNLLPYNSNKDIIDKTNNKESNKLLSTNEKNKFAFFDAECEAKGYTEIAKRIKQKAATETNQHPCDARFTESEMNAKIALWGEAYFWDMIGAIDAYLQNNSKYKAVSLPKMLITWFGDKEHLAVQLGINAMWQQKYGFDFKGINEWQKNDLVAIKSIAAKLTNRVAKKTNKPTADVSHDELKAATLAFFSRLPEKWANTKWFSLDKIASEFSQIVVEMQNDAKKAPIATAATPDEAKAQARATLTELGLTPKMIDWIAGQHCADMQSAIGATLAVLIRDKKITPTEELLNRFKQAAKVLKPSLK